MNKKKVVNMLYLLVGVIGFSLAPFKIDNPVWIAAWIAPIFMIRFMRSTRWIPAIVVGFLALQTAQFAALLPMMDMMESSTVKMDASFLLIMQVRSGMLFLALSYLVALVLDKALHKHQPRFAASLVYPSAVVAMELLFSLTTGVIGTVGDSQYAISPLVMIASLFGVLGVSFFVSWLAPVINALWEGGWHLGNMGLSGKTYAVIMAGLLIYGGLAVAFPQEAERSVLVAGITLENGFFERMGDSDLYVDELFALDPAGAAAVMSSPQSHVDEMWEKTHEAIAAGAKIIVWQEYALCLESSAADALLREIQTLADEADVYLLVSYGRLLNEAERDDRVMINMSVLFTPDGEIGWEYAKAYPAPGYEEFMIEAGDRDIPYVDTPYGRIGQVICADMYFPHYIRQAAVKEIGLLLVPTLDTQSMTPLATYSSGYRAVENGFTMVKVTGDGLSAVTDPAYRHWARQNSFVQGTPNLYATVPVVSHATVHSRGGYVFPYAAVLLLILSGAWAALRARRRASVG